MGASPGGPALSVINLRLYCVSAAIDQFLVQRALVALDTQSEGVRLCFFYQQIPGDPGHLSRRMTERLLGLIMAFLERLAGDSPDSARARSDRPGIWTLDRAPPTLIGRDGEVEAVHASLRQHGAAVVWGGAGEGKTAVAIQAAARLRNDEPDLSAFVLDIRGECAVCYACVPSLQDTKSCCDVHRTSGCGRCRSRRCDLLCLAGAVAAGGVIWCLPNGPGPAAQVRHRGRRGRQSQRACSDRAPPLPAPRRDVAGALVYAVGGAPRCLPVSRVPDLVEIPNALAAAHSRAAQCCRPLTWYRYHFASSAQVEGAAARCADWDRVAAWLETLGSSVLLCIDHSDEALRSSLAQVSCVAAYSASMPGLKMSVHAGTVCLHTDVRIHCLMLDLNSTYVLGLISGPYNSLTLMQICQLECACRASKTS